MKRSNISWFLAGSFFGTLATFLLDPVRGRYRRALTRDKVLSYQKSSMVLAGKYARGLSNRADGWLAMINRLMETEAPVTDEVLTARVRSEFGRVVAHPKSIYVLARDGVVTLSGQILKKELNKVVGLTCRVRGVRKVNNQLDVFDSAGKVPGLQGRGPEYLAA